MRRLQQREKLARPTKCPAELYDVMLGCWKLDAATRISSATILQQISLLMQHASSAADLECLEWPPSDACESIGVESGRMSGVDLSSPENVAKFNAIAASRESVTLGKLVGSGAFGSVYLGALSIGSSDSIDVAVKTMAVKGGSELEAKQFEYEARLLAALTHPHIVSVVAVCFDGFGHMLLVLELMTQGDLRSYLFEHREEYEDNVNELSDVCLQLCKAMMYLENRRIVHRDLAARFVTFLLDIPFWSTLIQ